VAANVAVVGHGYWGKNLARNFFELGALHTLCDENTAALEAVRLKYPGVTFCGDYSSVLADPGIAGVVLATPAVRHYEMARRALLAGKDVFVEKPLALDVKEGAGLVRLAADQMRILMVGHILQYHPAVRQLKQLIATGALGRVEYIYSNRLNIGKIRAEENILWSFAPHDISVLLGLLGEEPQTVSCEGGSYLNRDVPDVTLSQFGFANGVRAHIFVSWLHPFKEQRLVVVGSAQMAVFDDTAAEKLVLYPHKVEWKDRVPTAIKSDAVPVPLPKEEPLRNECQEFLNAIQSRRNPLTDGAEGLRVLNVLRACQQSLTAGRGAKPAEANTPTETGTGEASSTPPRLPYYAHPTAIVDQPAHIGAGSKIWHFSHILAGANIGERCIFGQNCQVAGDTVIGNNVKVQNNVSIYAGAHIDDDVFLGPSCVLTNVTNPRSQVNRHALYEKTFIRRGATIGANATIVCGITLGRYSFIAAGSVVAKDAPDYALMVGNPARRIGWMSRHGHRLDFPNEEGIMTCPESGYRYKENHPGVLRCLDLDEDAPLPAELSKGTKSYDDFKSESTPSH
jgi:UDP-2-acetamido-3-amino-2,3-dideoxy-glucuronate N-acetyltransferase